MNTLESIRAGWRKQGALLNETTCTFGAVDTLCRDRGRDEPSYMVIRYFSINGDWVASCDYDGPGMANMLRAFANAVTLCN